MWRVGLQLQLCATGAKWHPAKAQSTYCACLPACQSARLSACTPVCLPGCLLSADIIWGHAYLNVCRIFTAIVSNFMAQVVVNFVRAESRQLCICCGTQIEFSRIQFASAAAATARLPVACSVIDIFVALCRSVAACLFAVY